jgi:hypothetical protein
MLRRLRGTMLTVTKGDPMTDERSEQSLMEQTGLGLLPGVVGALAIVVFAMALLLTGTMWAVVGVLALVAVVTASILAVVIALIDESERGERLRRHIPGLAPRSHP